MCESKQRESRQFPNPTILAYLKEWWLQHLLHQQGRWLSCLASHQLQGQAKLPCQTLPCLDAIHGKYLNRYSFVESSPFVLYELLSQICNAPGAKCCLLQDFRIQFTSYKSCHKGAAKFILMLGSTKAQETHKHIPGCNDHISQIWSSCGASPPRPPLETPSPATEDR